MQRLFSTFPSGWPGVGLLLLRVILFVALIHFGLVRLSEASSEGVGIVPAWIAILAGVFLLAGLWTPLIAAVAGLDVVLMAFSLSAAPLGGSGVHIMVAVLASSVAMLGPGAWSVDARLFGRKRIDIDRRRGRKPPL